MFFPKIIDLFGCIENRVCYAATQKSYIQEFQFKGEVHSVPKHQQEMKQVLETNEYLLTVLIILNLL